MTPRSGTPMARIQITYWRDIPVLVTARDGQGAVSVSLTPRFQELVDLVAVQAGLSEADAYLAGWRVGPEEERSGAAPVVASAVAAELEARFVDIRARTLQPPDVG